MFLDGTSTIFSDPLMQWPGFEPTSESCISSRDLRKDALPAELRQLVVPVDHLGVLLSVLLEDELSLEAFVLVLASPPVLASLSLVLGHLEESLGWLSLNQKRHKKT